MQQINSRDLSTSGFMVILLGMQSLSPLALAIIAYLWLARIRGTRICLLTVLRSTGSGCFWSRVVGNVPMNNRLDALALGDGSAQSYWSRLPREMCTRLNHIRTVDDDGV